MWKLLCYPAILKTVAETDIGVLPNHVFYIWTEISPIRSVPIVEKKRAKESSQVQMQI